MSSTLSPQSVVRHADDLASVTLDAETVLYEPTREKFYRLDTIAATVWSLLDGETTLDTTCRELAEAFEADLDVIRHDVGQLVEGFVADGLALEVTHGEDDSE